MSNEETHEYKCSKGQRERETEDKRWPFVPSLSVSYSQHEIVWRWASAASTPPASPSPRSAAAASELTEGEPNREKTKEAASLALPWDFESGNSDLADGVTRRFDCSGWYSNWRGEQLYTKMYLIYH